MSYLKFKRLFEDSNKIRIFNLKEEYLGRLERLRVGRFMSWCLFLEPECFLSASCLDEVREVIRGLNAK